MLEELNRGIAATQRLRLELGRWETDAYPGFHPQGPQGLIDPILRIEDCDVLLGIFWKRFGTPTTDAGSGTEHEFLRAYAAWQQHGRPQIMVYFNRRDPKLRSTKADIRPVCARCCNSRSVFPGKGCGGRINGKAQFEKLVRNHLTQFLRQRGPTAPAAPPTPPGHACLCQCNSAVAGGSPSAQGPWRQVPAVWLLAGMSTVMCTSALQRPLSRLRSLRAAYLTWVIEQVHAVPLTGIDPKSVREETRRDLD